MTAVTLQQAALLNEELEALNPPAQVLRAGKTVLHHAAAGLRPPRDLMDYVSKWLARERQQQSRYGK